MTPAFLWSQSHETALNSAKRLVASTTGLRYYDPHLPVTLQVDASDNAVGGVLLQEGHPVHFTSHTLTNTERNYAQVEKQCLAIVSCMDKWHHYLYTVNMTSKVHSDHQPLETSFKKPLSRTLCRLQRMMLKLQKYRLPLVIRKRKSFLETLSREATRVHDDRTPTVMQECVVFHKQFYNQIGQSSFA